VVAVRNALSALAAMAVGSALAALGTVAVAEDACAQRRNVATALAPSAVSRRRGDTGTTPPSPPATATGARSVPPISNSSVRHRRQRWLFRDIGLERGDDFDA
jgi:hypothetical protein